MSRFIQLTLDLFNAPAAAPATTQVPAPAQVVTQPIAPVTASPALPGATKNLATEGRVATASVSPVFPPVVFAHPRATREAVLANTLVAFELRRGRRRNIGFTVGSEGLTVSAPKWVPLHEVDAAVQEKSVWIVRKLGEARERQSRIESARIEWKDGAVFPFLGESVVVVLDPRHNFKQVGAVLHTEAQVLPGMPRLSLHVTLPHTASAAQIRDAVQAWSMRQAKRLFIERLDHFAPLLDVKWNKLSLSNADTRWGTARSDGSIRLNWRLIHFSLPVIDYVVAHELSHLRVMDHSPLFWDTVRTVVPDFAKLRVQLKSDAVLPW